MTNRYDSGSTFVSPGISDADWKPLEPAKLPTESTAQHTAPAQPVILDVGQSKSFTSVQGSHRDRQLALERKYIAVVIVEAVTIGGLMLLGWLQVREGAPLFGAGWVVLSGIAAFVSFGWLNAQDHAHSPSGVERQKNQLAADVATETHTATVESWERVAVMDIQERYRYLREIAQMDHDQRMQRLGGRDAHRLPDHSKR